MNNILDIYSLVKKRNNPMVGMIIEFYDIVETEANVKWQNGKRTIEKTSELGEVIEMTRPPSISKKRHTKWTVLTKYGNEKIGEEGSKFGLEVFKNKENLAICRW